METTMTINFVEHVDAWVKFKDGPFVYGHVIYGNLEEAFDIIAPILKNMKNQGFYPVLYEEFPTTNTVGNNCDRI